MNVSRLQPKALIYIYMGEKIQCKTVKNYRKNDNNSEESV